MSVPAKVLLLVGLALLGAGVALGLVSVDGCPGPLRDSGVGRCGEPTQQVASLALMFTGGALAAASFLYHLTDPAAAGSARSRPGSGAEQA